MNRSLASSLAAAAVLVVTGSAGADVLVTRDGDRVQTAGPWKVQGRMVVFTLPGGALSSMRADQVDLDLSATATERAARVEEVAAEKAAEPAPQLGEPIFRITDKDVTPVPDEPEEGEEGFEGTEGEGEAEGGNRGPDSAGPLEVISWDQVDLADGDGLEIFGTVRNNSRSVVSAPAVTVLVYGERGGLLATSDGTVNQPAIAPGKTANFRAPLPGLVDFTAIKFDLTGRGYSVRDDGGGAGSGDEGEGEEAPAEEGEPSADEIDPGAKYDSMVDEEPPAEEAIEESDDDAYEDASAYDDEEPVDETEDEEPPPVE